MDRHPVFGESHEHGAGMLWLAIDDAESPRRMIAAPDAKPLIAANAEASDSGRISSRRRSLGRMKYATAAISGNRAVNMVPRARIPIRPSRSSIGGILSSRAGTHRAARISYNAAARRA